MQWHPKTQDKLENKSFIFFFPDHFTNTEYIIFNKIKLGLEEGKPHKVSSECSHAERLMVCDNS